MERSRFCSRRCLALFQYESNPSRIEKLRRPPGIKDKRLPMNCESCGGEFTPTGTKQRWCFVCCPGPSWKGRLMRYGISKPIWDEMVKQQNGMCALCDRPPTCVDHDHKTGRIRGLLCFKCNTRLAALDDEEWKKRAEVYIVSC
jgi:hypothetical protein